MAIKELSIDFDFTEDQWAGLQAAVDARNAADEVIEGEAHIPFSHHGYLLEVVYNACDSYFNSLVKQA